MSLLPRILPIFLLLGLGWSLRAFRLMDDATATALKGLVVRVVLPAVLFLSFVDMELKGAYLGLVALVFALCLAGLALGPLALRVFGVGGGSCGGSAWAPFLMTGYEYGMLGIGLVAGTWGLQAIGSIAVVALGHELFIWFVFFALLVARRDGRADAAGLVAGFARNPVVVAILAGLVLNAAGWPLAALERVPLVDAVIATLRMLAPLTAPLILIVIGHGLHLERGAAGIVGRIIAARLALQLPLAAIGLAAVVYGLRLEPRFAWALATLLLLPPPFIVPLFMPDDAATAAERHVVHRVLTAHTLLSLALFAALVALAPGL